MACVIEVLRPNEIAIRQARPHSEKRLGSLRKAVEALGLDYEEVLKVKPVNKKWVIKEIHLFVASGDPLSSLYTTHSALMRKSKRVFGTVARAFRAAGYNYGALEKSRGYPSRWQDKDDVLRAIRALPDTYYNAVRRTHKALIARAVKLFGSWKSAVEAAGLMYRHVPPRIWPGNLILRKIRKLTDKSHQANYGSRLYYSTRSAFGSWRFAVELVGVPYFEVEPRFRWTEEEVLYYVRWLSERKIHFTRRDYPELYRYALKFFGSRHSGVRAAESEPALIHFKHRIKRPREIKSNPEIAREISGES